MHTYQIFSEGARFDSLDCKPAICPAPRPGHPLPLDSKLSSSASLLLLLQHRRASLLHIEIHPDTA